MDLMTLAAKITLDDSSYTKGIKNAESMGQQLAGKMSAWTVAAGQLAADVIKKSVHAIGNVVNGAIDGYANYQQLIGGVETLFKSSANKVANYAKQSYKTTGLSANQYMETVTSFSASLLQGLKGDTEAAADLANTAITDMADNANKMGTDISSIQAAYQGFAKQNYTMLDNLKLGYGGTAGEMVRLINDSKILDHEISNLDGITFDQLVQAIHVVQTNLGITGTTAKEAADTISGSKASLASAWSDLLIAVAGTDQSKTDWWNDPLNESIKNFKESFSTYVENIVPTLVQSVGNSGKLVTAIADAVADLPTTLLSEIGEEALEAGTQTVGAASKITHWLIESISTMFEKAKTNKEDVKKFGESIGDFLATTITDIIDYAPAILENMVTVGVSLAGGLVQGLFKGLFGENAEVDKITEQLQDDLSDIDIDNAQATGILRYMDKLYEKYGNGVTRTAEWKQAQEELEKYLPQAGKVFQDYGANIQGAIDTLDKLNESMRRTAIISGMEKAMQEMKELYGEQTATAARESTRAEIRTEEKAALESRKNETAVALANEILKIYDDRKANLLYMGDRTEQVIANARHTMNVKESDNIAELIEAMENYYEMQGVEEADTVWGKNEVDNIVSPEELEKTEAKIAEKQKEITEAQAAAEEAQKQADATWEEIQITEAALKNAIEHQSDGYDTTTKGVTDGGAKVEAALSNLAAKVNSIKLIPIAYSYTPEATGIDNVPYTGFKASLHRGEAILTASEAEAYRNGYGTSEVVGAIQGLRNDMQNLRIVVGQKVFGQAVVSYGGDGMSDYIGGSDSRYAAGYGT